MSTQASNPAFAPDLAPTVGADLRPHIALCVDLDGTLVKSDTLIDSVLVIARQHPRALLQVPGWIAQGRAAFKRHVTSAVTLDVEHLPYNRPLLEYLRAAAWPRAAPSTSPRPPTAPSPSASPSTSASSPACSPRTAQRTSPAATSSPPSGRLRRKLLLHRQRSPRRRAARRLRLADGRQPGPRAAHAHEGRRHSPRRHLPRPRASIS